MFDVNKAIYACDDVICRNIESFTTEQRGLLSQNILSQYGCSRSITILSYTI